MGCGEPGWLGEGSGREVGRKGGKSGGDRDRTAGVTDAAAEEEEDMDRRKDGAGPCESGYWKFEK